MEDVIYFAQPFLQSCGALVPGPQRAFTSAVDAEAAGERMAQTAAGSIVFAVECDPANDIWGEVEVMARHGAQPVDQFESTI